MLENQGNLSAKKVKTIEMWYNTLNKKYRKNQGNLSVPKSGNRGCITVANRTDILRLYCGTCLAT